MNIKKIISNISLVQQIIIALILAILLAYFSPNIALKFSILGEMFIKILKSVAPILVFIMILAVVASQQKTASRIHNILILYIISTFLSASVAVIASYLFPAKLELLGNITQEIGQTHNSVMAILKDIIMNIIDNPVAAILNANYLSIITWAVLLALPLRKVSHTTKTFLSDMAHSISTIVKWLLKFCPIGIFGLFSYTLASKGFSALYSYAHLVIVLVSCMLFVALIINPFLVFVITKKNPYPLVLTCLKESGITAFFTRSSAANIPINLELCKKLNLNPNTYSISIPLGAVINTAGAAVTITVMTLATVNTLGINIVPVQAVILSFVASLAACGAAGIAGGSLLLIPLACSLFNISNDISAQVIGIGLVIGIIQDSFETALNSSSDVIFTAAVELNKHK